MRLNCKPDHPDIRDHKYALHPEMTAPLKVFPPAINLTAKQSPVVNQLDIGSCTGNAIAGALEYLELLEISQAINGPEVFQAGAFSPVSRLFIYYNERVIEGDPGQDAGAQIRDGITAVRKVGVCRESVWEYSDANALVRPAPNAYVEARAHHHLFSYRVDINLKAMKQCLVYGYPFVFGVSVYDSFMSESVAKNGIIPMPSHSENLLGGHALLCCGYNDATGFFTVKNSWGKAWGNNGYCYIPYDYLSHPDLCADVWTLRRE